MIATIPRAARGNARSGRRLSRAAAATSLLALLVLDAACGGGDGSGAGQGGGNGGREAGQGDSPTHVAVVTVSRGTVVSRYTTTATLEAKNRAAVQARAAGPIEKLLVEEGDTVQEGQVLLHLEDTQARIRLQKASIALRQETTMFERQKASLNKEVITQAEYDLAQTGMEAAQAERELAEEELSFTRVRAPFAGRIVSRTVDLGQSVSVGDELFSLANFNPLLARVHVPGKEIGTLRIGQVVSIVLDSNKQPLIGHVDLISPVIDPTTGTIKVTVKIDAYPEGTRPGDFAHVTIVTEKHEEVLRVPNIAMFEDRGDQIVYVAADSVAARRVVVPGFIDDLYTEITTGLVDGEQVIVKGHRSLRDAAPIIVLEGDTRDADATASESTTAQAREGS
jgi:membrane fusion protein (multidrug efflux system)